MRRAACIGVLTSLLSLYAGGVTSEASSLTPEPVVIGHSVTFRSEVLDEDRTILIALPGGYERRSERRFPVVYVLDGRSQFLHTTATIDVLSRSGMVPEMIVVGIANVDRDRDFTAIDPGSVPHAGGAAAFLDFIADELCPLVERSYRTLPHRTLIGHSLGGLFGLHTLISRPELFDAVIAISPALTADEVEIADQPAPFTERAEAFFESRESLTRFLYMTMSAGEDERWVDDLDRFRKILRKRAPDDLDWHLVDMPDDTHGTTVLRSTDRGLRVLYRGWNGAEVFASGDPDRLEPHYRRLSERIGYDVPVPEEAINRFGYALLEAGRPADAVTALEFNADRNPGSANAHDSLGEALLAAGHVAAAIERFQRAVQLAEASDHPAVDVYRQHLAVARRRAAGTMD